MGFGVRSFGTVTLQLALRNNVVYEIQPGASYQISNPPACQVHACLQMKNAKVDANGVEAHFRKEGSIYGVMYAFVIMQKKSCVAYISLQNVGTVCGSGGFKTCCMHLPLAHCCAVQLHASTGMHGLQLISHLCMHALSPLLPPTEGAHAPTSATKQTACTCADAKRGDGLTRAAPVAGGFRALLAYAMLNGNDVKEDLIESGKTVTFQDPAGETTLFFPATKHAHDGSSGPVVVVTTPKLQASAF